MPWDKLNEWSKINGGQGLVQPGEQIHPPIAEQPVVEIVPDPEPTYATSPQSVKDYIMRHLQEKEKYRGPITVPPGGIRN